MSQGATSKHQGATSKHQELAMYIRYTRYRKLEILGVLEAVGPLFLCVIRYTPYYKITEKSGLQRGYIIYIR